MFFDEENHSVYPMACDLDYSVWKKFLHGLSYSPNKEDFGDVWEEAMIYDSSITFVASGKMLTIICVIHCCLSFKSLVNMC